jgi:hypothetical protein
VGRTSTTSTTAAAVPGASVVGGRWANATILRINTLINHQQFMIVGRGMMNGTMEKYGEEMMMMMMMIDDDE